ncbi:hypothetical protein SDC9_188363 [bioreactor metagenome]|uniref:1-acyl-sn-glycerol-3-phosphate acyltransferase n=1 Tax=bioreactor metagenome TaxID=1076179 RepID=A0A645HZW3_9ZZZZ
MVEGNPGFAFLAIRAPVPIVPVAITGTIGAFKKVLLLQRPHLTAEFGEVIPAPVLERGNRDEQLQKLTEEIMCRIAAMLPEENRGFYTENPRVQEIIEQRRSAGIPAK